MRRAVRGSVAALAALLLAGHAQAERPEEAVSAFAANVGAHEPGTDPAPGVTVYVVPEGRTLLVTDVLVANHGQEAGPLYLADSQRTRCSVELLQTTLLPANPAGFQSYQSVHTTFSTGLPFAGGEPVVVTLAGGTRGVDVTITGKLVPGPRRSGAIRFRGGARDDEERPPETPPPPP
jgi:hypothetical protein